MGTPNSDRMITVIAPILIEPYHYNPGCHLLRVHVSINLIITIIKGSYFNAHFTDEKTAYRDKKLTLDHRARNGQRQDLKLKSFCLF